MNPLSCVPHESPRESPPLMLCDCNGHSPGPSQSPSPGSHSSSDSQSPKSSPPPGDQARREGAEEAHDQDCEYGKKGAEENHDQGCEFRREEEEEAHDQDCESAVPCQAPRIQHRRAANASPRRLWKRACLRQAQGYWIVQGREEGEDYPDWASDDSGDGNYDRPDDSFWLSFDGNCCY